MAVRFLQDPDLFRMNFQASLSIVNFQPAFNTRSLTIIFNLVHLPISWLSNGLSLLWNILRYFFLSLGVPQLKLPEAPLSLMAYCTITRIGHSNFLHQIRVTTPPKQSKLEL
jgi:hypothetical protein